MVHYLLDVWNVAVFSILVAIWIEFEMSHLCVKICFTLTFYPSKLFSRFPVYVIVGYLLGWDKCIDIGSFNIFIMLTPGHTVTSTLVWVIWTMDTTKLLQEICYLRSWLVWVDNLCFIYIIYFWMMISLPWVRCSCQDSPPVPRKIFIT